jgi:hypothetical protein
MDKRCLIFKIVKSLSVIFNKHLSSYAEAQKAINFPFISNMI